MAHLFRSRQLVAPGDSGVIARLDDGAPALVEKAVGGGKVLMWASSLDEYWTDLPLQPVFLPFVHELAKYAGRYGDARAWFQAGDVLDLSRHGELTAPFVSAAGPGAAVEPLVLESPSGRQVPLTASGANHLATLSDQGFYELRSLGTAAGSGRPIAVNVDSEGIRPLPLRPGGTGRGRHRGRGGGLTRLGNRGCPEGAGTLAEHMVVSFGGRARADGRGGTGSVQPPFEVRGWLGRARMTGRPVRERRQRMQAAGRT